MKRLGVCLTALLAGYGVAAAQEADVGQTCASVLKVTSVPLASIIEACTYIIEHPEDQGSQARALRYRGWAFERGKDLQNALVDLDGALELAPDDHWALQARARVNIALGDREKARADYRRLAQLQPGQTRWKFALSELGASPPSQAVARLERPEPAVAPGPAPAEPASAEPAPARKSLSPTPQALFPDGSPIRQTEIAPDLTPLIREVQTTLIALGYDPGPVHGRVSQQTREALDEFAADAGLASGQEPDQELLAAAKEELRQRQDQVAARQKELNLRAQIALQNLGHDLGVADGVFGQRSRKALAAWLIGQGRPPRENIDEAVVAQLEEAEAKALDAVVAEEASPPPSVPALSPETAARRDEALPTPATPTPERDEIVAAVDPQQLPAPEEPRPSAQPVVPPTGKRVALVIGNSAYEHTVELVNPRRDAEDIATALREIGFEVVEGYDLDRDALEDRTKEFAERAETADLALAYYSGHGLQVEGTNFLVPVNAEVATRRDLRSLMALDQLVADASEAKLSIVVVDACRDNPFEQLTRSLGGARPASVGSGLKKPEALPEQTLIAYAAAGNTVAFDGEGENSPYVESLLSHLKTPDVEVRLLFGKVRDDVIRATDNRQQPDIYASLGGEEVMLVRSPSGIDLAEMTPGERRAIQRSLKWLGQWDDQVDGEMSEGLREAVRAYQRDRGDPETGRLSFRNIINLHRQADLRRPPEPLPEISVLSLMRRMQAGEPEALRQFGMIFDPAYEALPGEPKNAKEALIYYREAAEKGDLPAAAKLGLMLSGRGRSPEEQEEARGWLERAAAGGDPASALRLADLLLASPEAKAERAQTLALLRTAAASPDTYGLASARLRDMGEPVVR